MTLRLKRCATGIAFYFMSPKWSYPVRTILSVRSERGIMNLDLEDHSAPTGPDRVTVESEAVSAWEGLENTYNYLEIHPGITDRGSTAIVDGIM